MEFNLQPKKVTAINSATHPTH